MSDTPYWTYEAKKRMRELGLKQEDLIGAFDVETKGAVSHYFTGRYIINVVQLEALSKLLGHELSYMKPSRSTDNLKVSFVSEKISTWLVKLKQFGMASYTADVNSIHDLIMDDIAGGAVEEQTESEEKIKLSQ